MRVHIVGIGGIGTSALSRWFLSNRCKVSGSDRNKSEITDELKKEGAKIFIGHKAKNVSPDINIIIRSEAISLDNPELKQARKLGIKVQSYSEAVGEIVKNHKTIAIAGAHGKSTTTGILSSILIENKFDPTIIVGTKLKSLGNKNFRKGKSEWLILEADEYTGAFLRYSPFAAIITNIDREHLDYYKNLSEIKKSFLKFISNIKPGGILIANKEDKNLFSLKSKISKIAEKNKLKVRWYGINDSLNKILKIPGKHNLSNATGAHELAKLLGIKEKGILKGIADYQGAWRRMEFKGIFSLNAKPYIPNASVYDDYAHHPSEIRATLAGMRQKWPKKALICVFQPHQAQRLKSLFSGFKNAFFEANSLILLDSYKVAGRDISGAENMSKKLFEAIQKQIKLNPKRHTLNAVYYLSDNSKLKKLLKEILNSKFLISNSTSCVVMMGAGDIYKLTKKLV
jgi:UDP-N-acetylmuramate--alanine ligase